MKTSFITYTTLICLTALAVTGFSHAGEKVRVIEMADGNIVTFKMTSEEIAAQEAAVTQSKRLPSAVRMKPQEKFLMFEMGESGIVVSFPATEEEAAESAANSDWFKLYNALSHQAESKVETFAVPESGYYLYFPTSRD